MGAVQPIRITSTQIRPYTIQFQRPFIIAGGGAIAHREGLILTLSNGIFNGQGEIAPLEGVSSETFKKAKHDLFVIEPQLNGIELPETLNDLVSFLKDFRPFEQACSSVRFGVESAIMDLVSQFHNMTLAQFLMASLKEVSTAILLQGSLEEVMHEAKVRESQGYKVFKLKVGDRNIPLDVKKVNQLRKILSADSSIRLDANRAWALNEAVLFGELIGQDRIEFIEEPLKDISHINTFYEKTLIPVALDETLRVLRCGLNTPGRCVPGLDRNEAVSAYVLKPTVLGGITVTLDWIHQSKDLNKKAIISSCFESPIGLGTLKNLALLTGNIPGLGTDLWFKQ